MNTKRITQLTTELKDMSISNGTLRDSEGMIVDFIDVCTKAFGNNTFKIVVSNRVDENIDLYAEEEEEPSGDSGEANN